MLITSDMLARRITNYLVLQFDLDVSNAAFVEDEALHIVGQNAECDFGFVTLDPDEVEGPANRDAAS